MIQGFEIRSPGKLVQKCFKNGLWYERSHRLGPYNNYWTPWRATKPDLENVHLLVKVNWRP